MNSGLWFNLLRKTAITTAAEDESVCIRKKIARATILMQAFCNTGSYFHMEKTVLKKNFVALSRFWLLRDGGWGLNESVKKVKFVTKIFFQIM